MLPRLWRRSEAAAPIRPLAWELLHVEGAVLKRKKKKKKTNGKVGKISATYITKDYYIASKIEKTKTNNPLENRQEV